MWEGALVSPGGAVRTPEQPTRNQEQTGPVSPKPRRGELRIYLGAAPGVGKTFAMLGEAHRRRERGTDVVIAFRDVTGALILRPGTPGGFELCGATQASCRWADARVDRQSIVLSGAGQATRVRYAWGGSPASPLTDASGLPAGPFEAPIR